MKSSIVLAFIVFSLFVSTAEASRIEPLLDGLTMKAIGLRRAEIFMRNDQVKAFPSWQTLKISSFIQNSKNVALVSLRGDPLSSANLNLIEHLKDRIAPQKGDKRNPSSAVLYKNVIEARYTLDISSWRLANYLLNIDDFQYFCDDLVIFLMPFIDPSKDPLNRARFEQTVMDLQMPYNMMFLSIKDKTALALDLFLNARKQLCLLQPLPRFPSHLLVYKNGSQIVSTPFTQSGDIPGTDLFVCNMIQKAFKNVEGYPTKLPILQHLYEQKGEKAGAYSMSNFSTGFILPETREGKALWTVKSSREDGTFNIDVYPRLVQVRD